MTDPCKRWSCLIRTPTPTRVKGDELKTTVIRVNFVEIPIETYQSKIPGMNFANTNFPPLIKLK